MIHQPVLLEEALSFLNLRSGGVYVDGTLGLGGHAQEILKRTSGDTRLIGIEWDRASLELAKRTLAPFGDRVTYVEENFEELPGILRRLGIERVDGILLDLGISSFQLQDSLRGFSFQVDGPLDMRMCGSTRRTAAALLNTLRERELARLFRDGGEGAGGGRIARILLKLRREGKRMEKTLELAEVVRRALGGRRGRLHPATRVFQALRIAVNDELAHLKNILDVFDNCLRRPASFDAGKTPAPYGAGGRMVVISFHSLEDRLVKHAFRQKRAEGLVRILTPKPVRPGADEIGRNPRSRSARLRAVERV